MNDYKNIPLTISEIRPGKIQIVVDALEIAFKI
jgi:hypothetical protein